MRFWSVRYDFSPIEKKTKNNQDHFHYTGSPSALRLKKCHVDHLSVPHRFAQFFTCSQPVSTRRGKRLSGHLNLVKSSWMLYFKKLYVDCASHTSGILTMFKIYTQPFKHLKLFFSPLAVSFFNWSLAKCISLFIHRNRTYKNLFIVASFLICR